MDLWTFRCGQNETFNPSSLFISSLLGHGGDQIIVGSEDGVLRIFDPFTDSDVSTDRGSTAADLLIEIDLAQPILQISVGKFISGSRSSSLAVLHPRSLAVYNFVTVTGSTEHGNQYQVYMVYEHQLKRSAFSMEIGSFGGAEGRDFVCVLGLDGTLMFYEQETQILARLLPNFLLPAPFVYVPHTDSFVILNANWFLESYRYQTLGEDSTEKPVPSWTYNLGESVNDMRYLGVTASEAALFIVTDWNFYCFNESGVMKFCKRLQYNPICSYIYTKGEPTVLSLIVTDTSSLMVYEQTTLKWAAQLPTLPVAIGRATLKGLPGCIVVLTENGDLQCSYLGTEPTLFVPPPLLGSVTALSDAEAKLATLQHQIATYSQTTKNSLGAPGTRPDVKISLKVWPMLEGDAACKLEIAVQAMTPVHNLHLNVCLQHPLKASPATHIVQNLGDTVELFSSIGVTASHTVPWDLEVSVLAVYSCSDSSTGTVQSATILPSHLVLELAPPSKDFESTIFLTARQAVILPTLFPEFSADSWGATGSLETTAGFRYKQSPDVTFTITLIKAQQKYRLDGNCISGLTLPVLILSKKLESKSLRCTQHNVALSELLDATDNNIELRNLIREHQADLKKGTAQMRAVQKRFLSKIRDKTPTDLNPLMELINYTHQYVMDIAKNMDITRNDLFENGTRLGSLIKLTIELIKLTESVSKEDVKLFTEAVSHTHNFSENQGWAEVSEIALNHLLRTTLARSVRDQYMPPVDVDAVVTDSTNLKKYISTAIERIVKSQSVAERAVSPIMEREEETVASNSQTPFNEFDAEVQKLLAQSSLTEIDESEEED